MKWLDGYRMRLMFASFIMAIVLGGIELANGATITVGPEGGYDFSAIQMGIDAAVDGDVVLVAPGVYVITEPITFRGKAITVRSEAGRDETTIQMGTPADMNRGSVVRFENNETTESVLEGFTITGGSGCRYWIPEDSKFAWSGGGIGFNASGTVRNCAIVQNRAEDNGGGISLGWGSSVNLTNCIISGNVATEETGGGVACGYDTSVTLTDCTITGNSAGDSGGGVIFWANSSGTLTDCAITGNSAGNSGGGMLCWKNSSATLTNCTIVQNSAARYGGGLCSGNNSPTTVINSTIWGNSAGIGGGGLGCWFSATVTNSIIRGNTAAEGSEMYLEDAPTVCSVTYSNVAGGQAGVTVEGGSTLQWGDGNIDADPLLVDPANGDYRLKSQAGRWDPNSESWMQDDVTSPCIDAGDPMSPIGLEPFPNGGFANMGGYGSTSKASKSYFGGPVCETIVAGDINGDCQVDWADLAIMSLHWTDDEPLPQ